MCSTKARSRGSGCSCRPTTTGTRSEAVEGAAPKPAHKVTRANDFMGLPAPLRNFFHWRNGRASMRGVEDAARPGHRPGPTGPLDFYITEVHRRLAQIVKYFF